MRKMIKKDEEEKRVLESVSTDDPWARQEEKEGEEKRKENSIKVDVKR
jgi:hypothetical protein